MRAMSNDEARLIRRAQRGDPAAFTEIYDRHQPAVYRYIYYRVSDVATAEDLTSEVFMRLVERIDRFTYRGRPLLAWLYTIARNLITDHHRRTGQVTMLPLDEQLVAETDDLEQAAERGLAQRRLAAALVHLTEDQRQVIILKFIEGLNNAEVAQMLGKPVGAVKSLHPRALAALRRVLERNGK
jgi:RNA polymerase sigma-70 factor (ECF subfamily)